MRILIALILSFFVSFSALPSHAEGQSFKGWLSELRLEASQKGISEKTLDAALTDLKPIPRVIELDRHQPEFTWTFRKYMGNLVNEQRIKKGKRKLAENKKALQEIGKKYGIQPRFLVAFWGLETDFGRLAEGYFPTIAALATLAHDGRRSSFFRSQLIAALKILDEGHISPQRMKGSWAGAMGHFQFIPTTFQAYAQDYDGDGKQDIWANQLDAYASAANFLTKSGWKDDQTWGREVKLPKGLNFNLADMKVKKTLAQWQKLGIRRLDGSDLPKVDIKASVVVPAGANGPAFLIYRNFRTIMVWNRSIFYAIAVGHLADRFKGAGPLSSLGPKGDKGLTRAQGSQLQKALKALGVYNDSTDGVVGPKTRAGIRKFQQKAGLVPDGYPSLELLESVKKGF